ncbi:hypothetical protein Bca101_088609 [Brassica carinata]
MDFNPFQDSENFVELLHSQQNVVFGSQGRVPLSSPQVPSFAKTESSSKRRKFADGSHSGASSQVNECDAGVEGTSRPSGVKAAKARGKKPQVGGQDVSDYQLMWSIKKDDLAMKQQLSKMSLLEKLLAKENLADYEEDLKKKLINELM